MKKEKFDVYGMSCAACQAHVDKAVNKLNGINECNVNLLTNSMEVSYDETKVNSLDIINAVRKAGYDAKSLSGDAKNMINKPKKKISSSLIKLIISLIILLVLMYIAMGHMEELSWPLPSFLLGMENAMTFVLVQFFLTIIIVSLNTKYFTSGFKKLIHFAPNMDSLIAIGASASLIYGVVAMFVIGYGLGHMDHELVMEYMHNLYFESAGTILTLVSLGKYLEELSKRKTTKSIENLVKLAPKNATILKDNKEINVTTDQIKLNDILIVKKGEAIAVDGKIVDGEASIDESNITGESIPVYKKKDDEVFSSTILTTGYLKIEATKVGEDTSINTIIKLVEEASNSKAPISKIVDKVSLVFVPTILAISLLTFLGFIIAGYGFHLGVDGVSYTFADAFNFAISVLVIACPCALGLATPVAIMVSTGKAAQNGLLVKNAEILENAHHIKTVVLDKTGTITLGKPVVTDFLVDKKYEDVIYSVENMSEHPLSTSITTFLKGKAKEVKIEDYETIDGVGLKGKFDGSTFFIGNKKLIEENTINKYEEKFIDFANEGKTSLYIKKDKEIIGLIAIKDIVKESSKEAIKELQDIGVNVVMLTGDNEITAKAIAKEVGIKDVISEVLPLDKAKVINSLKKDDHHLVAMVGDGVNDALALTSADIGIAIGAGSDVALNSSDIILKRSDLMDVKNIILLSKRTIKTIYLGLFWAFIYNAIGVVLATGVFYPSFGIKLNPMIGSLAMAFSSVFVVLNALTINLFKIKKSKEDNLISINKNETKEEEIMKLKIEGMMCEHCKKHVEDALKKGKGVSSVEVSLKDEEATIKGDNLNKEELIALVKEAGYKAK